MGNYNSVKVLVSAKDEEDRSRILALMSYEKDIRIVSLENDEADTVIQSEKLKPDVLILDLQAPGIDGIELVPMILRRSPSTSIILMSDKNEIEYAEKALKAGVSAYLLRERDMDKLVYAVKIVNLGDYYISASIMEKAMNAFSHMRLFSDENLSKIEKIKRSKLHLTPTERAIIEGLANGFSDNEIAGQMNLSTDTIRNYISAIKQKAHFKNRVQIVTYSLLSGLIKLDPPYLRDVS